MPEIPLSVSSAPATRRATRSLPIGAELLSPAIVHVRVWAPDHDDVSVVIDDRSCPLQREGGGYHSAEVSGTAGSRYGFRLGTDPKLYPDPASRSQPDGPHGLSEVVDPAAFDWHDATWRGVGADPVLYELHLGTFTPEGTAAAATAHLQDLADLGVTVVQLMPVADFPGAFGWGYDGVGLFAPSRLYGRPDDLRRFVDRAHAVGLAVILDVVYNHVGPDGNYLRAFAADYFTDRYDNEWGDPLNFDGPASGPVREWVLSNVAYWIREFHVDGFRLDATQQIFDASDEHLVAAIARRGARRGRRRARCWSRRRTSRSTPVSCEPRRSRRLRTGRDLQRGLPSLDAHGAGRDARGLLQRLPWRGQRVARVRPVGRPLPGPALRLAEAVARHAEPAACRAARACISSRTTIRSPTPTADDDSSIWRARPTCGR